MQGQTNPATPNCAKCGGIMHGGFILDRGMYDAAHPAEWAEGQPVKSFWKGGLNLTDKAIYEVTSYRCDGCGYLESYATTSVD